MMFITVCVSVALGFTGCSASADPAPDFTPALEAALQRTLDETGVPGGSVMVTQPATNDVLITLGEANTQLDSDTETNTELVNMVTAETRFAYRSITKSFVGIVILQLVDSGELTLDDPISAYVSGVPDGDHITIQQLGTMRSGLPNYSAVPEFADVFLPSPERDPSTNELLEIAFEYPPEFAPGSAYEYSNTNTLLLGEVIEQVTGSPWQEVVQERVITPLQLSSVHYGFSNPANEEDARGFQLADGEAVERLPQVPPGWFGAAGALTGSIADLAVWGRALGEGSLIDSQIKTRQRELLGSTADDPASPEYDRYGFGIGEIANWVGHTGNGLGFQSLTMYDAVSGRTIAILLNGTGDNADVPADLFRDIIRVLPEA